MSTIVETIENSLNTYLKKNKEVLIAVSGGLDSVVLLHTLIKIQKRNSLKLKVIHVNHQISKNANRWEKFVKELCVKNKIPFISERVCLNLSSKLGLEGEARKERYRVFNQFQQKSILTLAQHQDDQVETLFLQLARGAGIKGLAGMPEFDFRRKIWRPLLSLSRGDLETYAKKNNFKYINDESNLNLKFDRNYIRHKLVPLIKKRFPYFLQTTTRSINHIASHYENQVLINEQKYKKCFKGDLKVLDLNDLSLSEDFEYAELYRYWFTKNNLLMPSAKVMAQLVKQTRLLKDDQQIKVRISDYDVRSFKQKLYLVSHHKNEDYIFKIEDKTFINPFDGSTHVLRLRKGKGVKKKLLQGQKVTIRPVKNLNQKIKTDPKRPARSLKVIFQEHNIPPWVRNAYPGFFVNGTLIALCTLAIDYNYQCKENQLGYFMQI
ncbi:MAG: tRNA lysidine(34) synthetase TilS [Nitrosomonadales bacterium]